MILHPPRAFFVGFVLVLGESDWTVHAQELNVVQISSNKRTVVDALKTLDSPNTKEQEWVMPFLEKTLQEDPGNSLASTALALQQIRTQDFKAASQTLQQANETQWGGVTRSTNGKAKLLCAINLEDVELANKLFAALVDATQRDAISLAVRKSYCQWLGEIIGTIESPEAKSPIPNDVLLKARKTLLASSEVALSEAFRNQFELAKQKSGRVEAFMAKHRELGDDGLEKIRLELAQQLRQMEIDLNGELQERRDIAAENNSATRSVRLDLAANRERLRQFEQEWATPTAGQPLPMAVPVAPIREWIFVDLFQIRWVTSIVNGRLIEYQIQERRPSWDVETERDAIFQSQMASYNSQLALYKSYQKSLAEWNKLDSNRRAQLQKRRQEIDNENATLRTQLAQLEKDRKDNRGGLVPVKKTIAELKDDLEVVLNVQEAGALGKPHLALRPLKIDPWLISDEKNRLLRLSQGAIVK